MSQLTAILIIALTCFFFLGGFALVVLGIYLYRRQPKEKNKKYVTEVKRPEDFGLRLEPGPNWPEREPQPLTGDVHRRRGELIPSDLGNLFDKIPANLSVRQEPILPADVSKRLESAMLNGRYHLEDANYGKIVPNFYVIEVSPENYEKNYEPIAPQACEQWQQRLLNALNTANGRQGRKVFRFGGPVQVLVRPVADLSDNEVRILTQIRNEALAEGGSQAAYLEAIADGRRHSLVPGVNTLGRSPRNDIFLDTTNVQDNRLVSNEHAYIKADDGRYYIYDGSPGGKPSKHGTYVNGRGITASGHKLADGDVIILAAIDQDHPRPDTPGVAGFIFRRA